MIVKLIAGLVGLAALIAFLVPPIVQIKEISMAVVGAAGVIMAGYELFESLRDKEG